MRFNIKAVAVSQQRQNLRGRASRKYSPISYCEHSLPVSERLLKQVITATGLNQKWVDDITYLRPDEGCFFLAVVIDL